MLFCLPVGYQTGRITITLQRLLVVQQGTGDPLSSAGEGRSACQDAHPAAAGRGQARGCSSRLPLAPLLIGPATPKCPCDIMLRRLLAAQQGTAIASTSDNSTSLAQLQRQTAADR